MTLVMNGASGHEFRDLFVSVLSDLMLVVCVQNELLCFALVLVVGLIVCRVCKQYVVHVSA
jgi:hypothetical protein